MVEVHCMKKNSWWILHSVVFGLITLLTLASFFLPWGSYDDGSDNALVLSGIYNDDEEEVTTWADLADDASGDPEDTYNGIGLASLIYFLFSIIAMLSYIAAIILLILDICGKFSKTLVTVILVWVSFGFYLIGYIAFMAAAKITFGEGDEMMFDLEGDQQNAGAEVGGILGLIVVLLGVIAGALHTYVWFKSNKAAKTTQNS